MIDHPPPAGTLSPTTLLLLGEIASKSDHIARIPYPDFATAVDARAVALCAAANTALAGLRLSRSLTDALHRECAPHRDRVPASKGDRAFANLVAVLVDDIEGADLVPLSLTAVTTLNARLVAEPLAEAEPLAGSEPLAEAERPAVEPTVGHRWARDLEWAFATTAVDTTGDAETTVRVRDAFLRATTIHLSTLRHRPFAAANGRTARVLEAAVLVRAGLPLRVSGLLACWYAEDPRRYRAIIRQTLSTRDDRRFVDYAVAGLTTVVRDELEYLHQPLWMRQQARYVWTEFVASHFVGDDRPASVRRCRLAADLPADGVERSAASTVSAAVAECFDSLLPAVRAAELDRDLAALEAQQLITLDGGLAIPRFDRVPRWIAPI